MKTSLLSLVALVVLSVNSFAQTSPACNANVEALEEQIKILAEMLGDDELINEVNTIQKEREEKRITLSENDPNPFEVEQDILLDIPESASEVELVFMNSLGQQIKALDILERGNASIKVYMSQYLKNNFNYQLVIDGTPIKS